MHIGECGVFQIPTSQDYKHQKAYIIAEGPMAFTVRNMWKLVCDQKCGALASGKWNATLAFSEVSTCSVWLLILPQRKPLYLYL